MKKKGKFFKQNSVSEILISLSKGWELTNPKAQICR